MILFSEKRMLTEKQPFKELRDAYVIFICQHDKFKQNNPIYHIDKIIRETGELFDDGAHIIYVNGKYRGDDAFGKLTHDFNCKLSKDMYYKEFAEGVKHFKEDEKGRYDMCEAVEKYAAKQSQKSAEASRIATLAKSVEMVMHNTSVSLEQAFDILEVVDKDRQLIVEKLAIIEK